MEIFYNNPCLFGEYLFFAQICLQFRVQRLYKYFKMFKHNYQTDYQPSNNSALYTFHLIISGIYLNINYGPNLEFLIYMNLPSLAIESTD